ncbi:hypothetical protein [Arthrobacter sp. ISL-95]|uniref:hypothetical protein n=1 Tax=Arthrobacter sp. ISL-95 TaxID=2819116 RepID=UPI001BE7634D|nr:hypothetical protein [Arthrobacter sp. ISL-95]MBT2587910.1 hypothetical protein [Arthrobacter sp. ISL-95]
MTDYINLPPDNFRNLTWIDEIVRLITPEEHWGNVMVAGGAFKHALTDRSEVKDLDVFFLNQNAFDSVVSWATEEIGEPIYVNEKSTGFKTEGGVRLDVVQTIFGTPEEILDSFDFTVTQMALTPLPATEDGKETFRLICHPNFFEHLHMKRLVIETDDLPFPISTFERSYRYNRYGFGMCKDSRVRLLLQLAAYQPSAISADALSQSLYDGMD